MRGSFGAVQQDGSRSTASKPATTAQLRAAPLGKIPYSLEVLLPALLQHFWTPGWRPKLSDEEEEKWPEGLTSSIIIAHVQPYKQKLKGFMLARSVQ